MPAPDYAVEIAALDAAMSAGELTVETNGERVTYQSFEEIDRRIKYFERKAAVAAGRAGAAFGFSAVAYDRN